jgi:hypothetical protein
MNAQKLFSYTSIMKGGFLLWPEEKISRSVATTGFFWLSLFSLD